MLSRDLLYSSVSGHSHRFSALIDNSAVSVGMQLSFQVSVSFSFEYILSSEIAGSYGSFSFEFVEDSPYCFP